MSSNHSIQSSAIRFGGWAGIFSGIFLVGVAIQMSTGWFPEEQLEKGNMSDWLSQISQNPKLVLLGIGFSIISILCFFPIVYALHQKLPASDWRRFAGWCAHMVGIPLSLVAFTLGFGFTLGLLELSANQSGEVLAPISRVAMRGFLMGDDLATTLLGGFGNGFLAWSALRAKALPKWICWIGIISATLVTIVLLRYFIPFFAFAMIGYPMILVFFVSVGVYLLKTTTEN